MALGEKKTRNNKAAGSALKEAPVKKAAKKIVAAKAVMIKPSEKGTITKKQLVLSIAEDCKQASADVRIVIQAFLDKMVEALSKGNRLEFRDFGVFEVVLRKQKIGRNPRKADEAIIIPERYVVKFAAGKKMKKKIEQTF